MAFVLVGKNETLVDIRDRLVARGGGAIDLRAVERLIRDANPDIDFNNLPRGAVLTIPESPMLTAEGDNPAVALVDGLEELLLHGMKELQAEVAETSGKEVGAVKAANKFLGTAAGRALLADPTLSARLKEARKFMGARGREVEDASSSVDTLGKRVRRDFAEIRRALR